MRDPRFYGRLNTAARVIGANEPRHTDDEPCECACANDYAGFANGAIDMVLRDAMATSTWPSYLALEVNSFRRAKHLRTYRPLGLTAHLPMVELDGSLGRAGFRVHLILGLARAMATKDARYV